MNFPNLHTGLFLNIMTIMHYHKNIFLRLGLL